MDLLESLGIAPPAAENAVCYEIYDQAFVYGKLKLTTSRAFMALQHFQHVQRLLLPACRAVLDLLLLRAGGAEAQLEALRVRCMQLVWPYLEGYIWQHDAFTIQSSLQQLPPWVLKKRGMQSGGLVNALKLAMRMFGCISSSDHGR